ncbi:MAG: acyl carrier protein, partial [Clostridia bacterium]|nr:acyl carrier protein [Clostridia bacterium]
MFEKVCAVLAEQLNVPADSIKPTDDIVKDLNADSIDVVE